MKASLRRARDMVLLRPKSLQPRRPHLGGLHGWGAEGFAEEGRSQELLEVHIPSLKQTCDPQKAVERVPSRQRGGSN